MSITAMTGLTPDWFTPAQQEGEQVARFLLKPLTGFEFAGAVADIKVNSERGYRALVSKSLIGWENVLNESGEQFEFKPENFDKLPGIVLLEIGDEAYKRAVLAGEKEKN